MLNRILIPSLGVAGSYSNTLQDDLELPFEKLGTMQSLRCCTAQFSYQLAALQVDTGRRNGHLRRANLERDLMLVAD